MIRQRSSSRWSRNGISPVGDFGIGIPAETSLPWIHLALGKSRLVRLWEIADEAVEDDPRLVALVRVPEYEPVLVQRRRRVRALRILRRDELVYRVGGGGVPFVFVAVSNVHLRARSLLIIRVGMDELLKPGSGRSIAAISKRFDGRREQRRRARAGRRSALRRVRPASAGRRVGHRHRRASLL